MGVASCVLFHFYIKPQLCSHMMCCLFVVSYSISTSNHNNSCIGFEPWKLCLIPFLHQTTTHMGNCPAFSRCVLFHFYIKPQLSHNTCSIIFCCVLFHFYIKPQRLLAAWPSGWRCVLFHFYIKPQLCFVCHKFEFVVSYSISTSNHNMKTH